MLCRFPHAKALFMFTGIVHGTARLADVQKQPGLFRYTFAFPSLPEDLKVGDSIAINGACLTVTHFDKLTASFDLMATTLEITTLGKLEIGQTVNYEPAARFGDSIGGHAVSGHIHCQALLVDRQESENNLVLEFEVPPDFSRYLFDKGYIAVAGASLTISRCTERGFCVSLIPETRRLTIFGNIQPGDSVNLEIDSQTQTTVDTIERLLPQMVRQALADEKGRQETS